MRTSVTGMGEFVQVVTTVDGRAAAQELARSAVTARLAACAQVGGPITSTYRWQGAVEEAEEWVIVLKTTAAGYAALERHLLDAHPYDTPEVLCVPILAGNPAYLAWITDQTLP
ncbi:divalent-cation tolerance protein CutA [Saccharothrix algeriensis]|uniref:Divalent cation tolerance protein n=2 Tax=Catellatospora bangladeshensis TaxID=310355 RepID=A0A8J3JPD0_9ACTN|nr:divalent cation tolerance protein [Catellatospora bangladeshensis]